MVSFSLLMSSLENSLVSLCIQRFPATALSTGSVLVKKKEAGKGPAIRMLILFGGGK